MLGSWEVGNLKIYYFSLMLGILGIYYLYLFRPVFIIVFAVILSIIADAVYGKLGMGSPRK